MSELHASAALVWYESGACPVPVAPDRSKRPAISWRELQHQRMTREELVELFTIDSDGLGVITGEISGQLEMIELEARAVESHLIVRIIERLTELGLINLWTMIVNGYSERTPSGGIHTFVRVHDGGAMPNTRLACTATNDVLIETRGEGGFSVVAPSNGRSHPTGLSWELLSGGPSTIAYVSSEERDELYAALAEFDERRRVVSEPQPAATGADVGERPGDDFNVRASWGDVLHPHGWSRQRRAGDVVYWRKPGKRSPGCSATTGRDDADRLYVFSTATEFEPGRPYSKFGAYALLDHGGDFAAAARALRQAGYGGTTSVLAHSDASPLKVRQIVTGDVPAAEFDNPDGAIDLEELFWTSRPVLAHLRRAAHARVVSSWAVFGCAMLRVLNTVPPFVVLPPLIGGDGSLNAYVALVGPPGSGKSGAMSCARDALLLDSVISFPTLPLGSGEGIVRTYREYDAKEKALVEVETSAMFVADEVDTMRALFERSGSTLIGQLKSAYVAGDLGFANANKERRVWLPPHSYRLTLLVGVQPGRGRALLDDADGGTPQRFIWLPALDVRMPQLLPSWPTPLTLSSQVWTHGRLVLAVPDEIAAEIVATHQAAARGERDPLDGHALFAREKVAQALCLLDGRRVMTLDDWELAGIVMIVSNRTRASVIDTLASDETKKAQQRDTARARSAVTVETHVRAHSIERVAENVLRKLAVGELSAGVLRAKLPRADRDMLDDAIELLIERDRIVVEDVKQGGRMLKLKR